MIIYVPHPVVRTLFLQQELVEKRENWMTYLQEYDLEFNQVHIIMAHGFCQLVVESRDALEKYILGWDQ